MLPASLPSAFESTALMREADYDESRQFKQLQQRFAAQFESVFPDKFAAKTVVIVPSLTLDQEILDKIKGVIYYEERLLCLLMLLRMPRSHVIYLTSMPIDPVIVDYYLHLLPGITGYHSRQRLTLLSCFDASPKSLTEKILERPRLIERIRRLIPTGDIGHLSCFNVTDAERKLALELQLPIYGCDPDLLYISTKSYGRKIFRECGLDVPPGFEDLHTKEEIVKALVQLKTTFPGLSKAVIKIDEGFSGEGNAVFSYRGSPGNDLLPGWIDTHLAGKMKIVAEGMRYHTFMHKFNQLGGIVEAFIEESIKQSPSVQCRINPLGKIDVISTHDQLLGGEDRQVFLGATFPASHQYAGEIGEMGRKISERLRTFGVIGRFSIDFISVQHENKWIHYPIEINLRKGGTTHPYLMLQFLTDGKYNEHTGIYTTGTGQSRYYFCSDNLQSEHYKGLTPHDLIEIAVCNNLLYDGSTQEGVMFHLISTLSQFGKLGVVCIGATPDRADMFYHKTVNVLDTETRK
jgi:hypothetical protein